jgi:hypothetical protein
VGVWFAYRVKHVTGLLSESERECARLWQLSELLKVCDVGNVFERVNRSDE